MVPRSQCQFHLDFELHHHKMGKQRRMALHNRCQSHLDFVVHHGKLENNHSTNLVLRFGLVNFLFKDLFKYFKVEYHSYLIHCSKCKASLRFDDQEMNLAKAKEFDNFVWPCMYQYQATTLFRQNYSHFSVLVSSSHLD